MTQDHIPEDLNVQQNTPNITSITQQDRHRTFNVTLRHVHATIVAVGKAMSITQPECAYL
jgi:hypothetical protein